LDGSGVHGYGHAESSMLLTNEVTVDAPPDELFAFVSDVERVAPCLPGARIDESNGDEYRGSMRVRLGPIVANYAGTLRYVELDRASRRAVLRARAQETAGQGQAEARIETVIEEVGDASRIRMDTDLQIRGRVAQFGRGAMEKVAQRLFADFAHNLEAALAGGEPQTRRERPAAAPAELDLLGDSSALRLLRALAPALIGFGYGYLLGRLREANRRR
jgi:uncharacterized protein